jgi:transformation/transcription domain-associated protein
MLQDYAKRQNLTDLGCECAALLCDWPSLRAFRHSPTVIAELERGSPWHKLFDIMLSVVDGKYNEADKICAQCVQMLLLKWQQLPPPCANSQAHKRLLHMFHRVIEMKESVSMMIEVCAAVVITYGIMILRNCHLIAECARKVSKASRERSFPDLKPTLHTWREKLPNSWDPFCEWDAMLTWRLCIFKMTLQMHESVKEADKLAQLQDTPWTIVR